MKKNLANKTLAMLLAVLLAALCVFAGGRTTANAEEAAGPHNYLTAKWDTSEFPGNLTETEEDGVRVTTYTPNAAQPWFSASMNVLDDVKTLAEGKDFVEVVFCMEISGEFSGGAGGGEANCGVLLRAVSPRDNSIAFSGTNDRDGVGALIEYSVKAGRGVRKNLKVGICGEQGGDPKSVALCHALGLNYVSCSPFRVPIARLAAAQAAVEA